MIPTVIDNRVVSNEQAIDHYRRTGENFGTFKTIADADAYAEALHQYHAGLLEREASQPRQQGFAGVPGERVTSTYRSPAKNKSVGGVSNSYHMRRYPDGSPMARDSVPPPGMSMAQYVAELRRLNPHLEVINEGDHAHIEPRG